MKINCDHKVSIVIPTRNRFQQLQRAVQSVLDQTMPCYEIIIIDDASDELEYKRIQKYVREIPIITLMRNDYPLGVSTSRNLGIERCTGDFLLFLDDDDTLNDFMLEKSIRAIVNDDLDVVSCRSEVIDQGGRLSTAQVKRFNDQSKAVKGLYAMGDSPKEHLLLYHPSIHTFLVRRLSMNQSRFDERFIYGEDFIFWLSLADQNLRFRKLDFIGVKYWFHDTNISLKIDLQNKLNYYDHMRQKKEWSYACMNILKIHRTGVLLKERKLSGLIYLIHLLVSPILTFRHLKHLFIARF